LDEALVRNTCESPGGADRPFILVLDCYRNEPFLFQRRDISRDLAGANTKKLGEVTVRGKAPSFVIQAVDFNEQNFFHDRKVRRKPDLLWNPNTFEVPFGHVPILTRKYEFTQILWGYAF
jgi:hypothetical protein